MSMKGWVGIFQRSIRRKIVSIAAGLVILMAATSLLSLRMSQTTHHLLDELTSRYVPAYGHLARTDIRTLERALAVRRMVIAKMEMPPDEAGYSARLQLYKDKDRQVEEEAQAARALIVAIIDDVTTPSDNASLARIDTRIDVVMSDLRHRLNEETAQLIASLEQGDVKDLRDRLAKVDQLRDEFNDRIEAIRADMLKQVYTSAGVVIRDQQQAMLISGLVTLLAAVSGLGLAMIVSSGITRPVRRLLEGTRRVEAGHLESAVAVTTRDEIGQLSLAFNHMVEQLRRNERIRETFGRYIDPRVVQGLIDDKSTATEGQRRVMTVLFCDMKGFTAVSEGMTPQGLVKVMNRYLSTMSEPIRQHRGIIDKYIGDAIMAYWGPPFVDEAEQAKLACLAALDMLARVAALRSELPELLGVRNIQLECDVRIGIATGEALVGSIGSELMMSYTVMGDAVNLASRLESANKVFGTRSLVSAATFEQAAAAVEMREIDRLVVVGQTKALSVHEIMAPLGGLTGRQGAVRARYAEALGVYRARRWNDAERAFRAVLELDPEDGPSSAMLERVAHLRAHEPPADWDGAWHLDHK
jgi:adenylate cyclase